MAAEARPAPIVGATAVLRSSGAPTAWSSTSRLSWHEKLPSGLDCDQLVVLLSTATESGWRRTRAAECASHDLRWIDLVLDPDGGVRLGPLSRADWSVCTSCAEDRIEAARGGPPPSTAQPPAAPAELAALLLDLHLPALLHDVDGTGPWCGHLVTVDRAATTASRHAVVASPGCPCCPGPIQIDSHGDELPTDLNALLTRLDGWVGPLTGVIPTLRLEHPLGTDPRLPTIATAAQPRVLRDGAVVELPVGWGKGLGDGPAVLSAVGEAVERYSASLPDRGRLVWARVGELDGDVLRPDAFPTYSDEQFARHDFPCARWDPALEQPWVRGYWYGSDHPVWVPAVFAYLRLSLRPHQRIIQGSSNGLAAGASVADAADRAVLELVERDAFLAAWHTGRAFRRIDPASLGSDCRPTVAGLRALGVEIDIAVVDTSVAATTIAAIGRGDGVRLPGACVGLAAGNDPARVAASAVLELAQTLPHLTGLMRSGELDVPSRPQDVRTMLDHAAYFFPTDRATAFDRLFAPSEPVALSELSMPNGRLPDLLARTGVRVAIIDVTAPDVAAGPFRVCRAVSPDLATLSFGWGMDRPVPPRVLAMASDGCRPPVHPVW